MMNFKNKNQILNSIQNLSKYKIKRLDFRKMN